MKKYCCLIFWLPLAASAQGIWTQMADLGGGGRESAVGFSIGTKGYIGTGYDLGGNYLNDFWEWDKATNVWTQKANFAGAGRESAFGFYVGALGAKGYVGGGDAGSIPFSDFWEWDQATNVWTAKANMPAPRTGAAAFSMNSYGYIVGGDDGTGPKNTFYEYRVSTDTWTVKPNFPGAARSYAVGFGISNRGFIGTGVDGGSQPLKDFWEWNQGNQTWYQRADYPGGPVQHAAGFSVGARGYIYCDASANNFWEWRQTNSTWVKKTDFPAVSRNNAVGFGIGSKGYMGSGQPGKKDFWEFDTVSTAAPNTWLKKADFAGAGRESAAAFSIGTKGYIGVGATQQDFWEWDQATDTWTQKANVPGGDRQHSVGFSIGNKGYIGTGTSSTAWLADFWEWNPATNTWVQIANIPLARMGAVAFTIGNKGYVGTGYPSSTTNLKDFWEWNPATNVWTQKADFGGIRRYEAVGFSIGNKGYIGIGHEWWNSTSLIPYIDFWEWDQATNVWTKKADYPGLGIASAVGFSIGSRGYIGTGAGSGSWQKDFWEWDQATDTWTKKADFIGSARGRAVGFSIGNKGYIGTGYDAISPSQSGKTFYEWMSPHLFPIITQNNVSCKGGSNGAAYANVEGGTAPYTYSWSTGQTSSAAIGLAAGNYTLTVTDNSGASVVSVITIIEPAFQLANSPFVVNASSCTVPDGMIYSTPSGGTPPYTYLWNPTGQTTSTATGLAQGSYSLTLTDANGCMYTEVSNVLCVTETMETSVNNDLSLVPNPSSGTFTIRSSEKIRSVEVWNILGEVAYSSTDRMLVTSISVDMQYAPKGVYYYKITNEVGKVSVGRLVIQ